VKLYLNNSFNQNLCVGRLFIIVGFIWIFCMGNIAFAEKNLPDNLKVFYTFGHSGKINDNAPKALKDAISDSLISATESAVINMLPPDVIVDNFQAINEILSLHTKDSFISQYNVLMESEENGYYKVIVKAIVDMDIIRKYFKVANISAADGTMPKILLMISEKLVDSAEPVCCWLENRSESTTISDKIIFDVLQKNGFSILNQTVKLIDMIPKKSFPTSDKLNICVLTNEEIVALGKKYGADVIISGKIVSVEGLNTMGSQKSFKAVVEMKAIRIDLGKVIASTIIEDVVMDENTIEGNRKAVVLSVTKAADDIALKIAEIWKKISNEKNMSYITLTLEGYKFYPSFIKFREAIVKMNNVINVQTKEMMSNKAILSIDFSGNKTEFATALIVKSFSSFGIQIAEETLEQNGNDNLEIKFISLENN